MSVEQASVDTTPLHWLPAPEALPRELDAPIDGLPAVIDWLSTDQFTGAVTLRTGPNELALLVLGGHIVAASLRSTLGQPALNGPAAMRGLIERAGPTAATHTRLLTLARPVAECLTAVLDPQPTVRSVIGTEDLREALRDLASISHHGVVDLVVGEQWGRTLYYRGRLLGAYDCENPAVAPSLAGLGRLAASGRGTLLVRVAASGPLPQLEWPTLAVLADRPAETAPPPVDDERDDRIETNLLWLLSHVDRDCERALRSADAESRVLQVLASFTNAVYSFAAHLAPEASERPEPLRLPVARESLRAHYPLVDELELRGDEIDAQALARRYRAVPRDGTYAADFYQGMAHTLLALTQQAVGSVLREIAQPGVRQRCATAMETWMGSVEAALPRTGEARTGDVE
jgi:hypothetical protein